MRSCGDKAQGYSGTFAAFDGLRAIAAFLVVTYHVALMTGLTRHGALAPFAAELKGGVTIFFVISGFLLYLPCARAIRDGRRLPDWRGYARRRAVRIVPAYWVALTILGLAGIAVSVFSANWWRYYGMVQIYDPFTILGGMGVAWSLCVEVTFYICLPFLARGLAAVVRRRAVADPVRTQLTVVVALGLASIALRGFLSGSVVGPAVSGGSLLAVALPGMFDWFGLGIGLAVLATAWEHNPHRFPMLGSIASNGWLCWINAAVYFLAGSRTGSGDTFLPLYGVWTHVMLGLAAAFVVLPAIAPGARRGPVRALSTPFVRWLGTISYGIYLWHVGLVVAIRGINTPLPNHAASVWHVLTLYVVVVVGAVCLGAASWYLVERPTQRLPRRSRAAATVVLAPQLA